MSPVCTYRIKIYAEELYIEYDTYRPWILFWQESFSLSESAKQLQRRRYRRRLLRRSCVGAAGCWAGRMEVCRRLLKSVDVLAATC